MTKMMAAITTATNSNITIAQNIARPMIVGVLSSEIPGGIK